MIAATAALLWAAVAHLQHPFVRRIPALRPALFPIAPLRLAAALAADAAMLAAAAAVLAGVLVGGRRVRRWLRGRAGPGAGFDLAAGLLAASVAIGGIGLAGLFFRPVVAALPVLAVAAALRRPLWSAAAAALRAVEWRDAWPGLALLTAVPWLLAAPLLPVTDVDMLEYHAGLPALWLLHHRLHAEIGNVLCFMPLGFERLAVPFAAFGLHGVNVCAHLLLLAAAGIAVGRALGAAGGPSAALAGWLVPGCGAALVLGAEGHPDTGLLFGAALGVLALARGSAVDVGLVCALQAATKYQGGGLALTLLASALPWTTGRRRLIRFAVTAGTVTAGACTVWLARNWLLTGNPVFPFASERIPSLGWTAWNTQVLWGSMPNASIRFDWTAPEDRAVHFLTAFWEAAGSGWFAPYVALVYVLPVVLWGTRRPPLGRRLALHALLFAAAWVYPVPKFGRYLLPGLVPAIGAWWLLASRAPLPLVRAAVAALAGAGGLSFVAQVTEAGFAPERVLVGGATSAEFRRAALGCYDDAVGRLNGRAGFRGRTLVVGQGYGFGLARAWLASNETGRPAWLAAAGEAADAGRQRVRLRQAGVRWVLYNPIRAYHRHGYALGYALSEAWFGAWADVWRRWASTARPPDRFDWTGEWYVYAIDRTPHPPRPLGWLPGAERLWVDEHSLLEGQLDADRFAALRRVMGDFGIARFQASEAAFYVRHDPRTAVGEARAAIATDFALPGAWGALATYLAATGRVAEAIAACRRGLALAPEDVALGRNLEALRSRLQRSEGRR